MKKIRVVKGKKIAFIEKTDIETLNASKEFVRPELFAEPSIINMECDTEGFYRINNSNNAEYIESLGYIPDFDSLNSLSIEELNTLADKAISDKTKINEIIKKLCEYKKRLEFHEKRILKKASYLDHHCVTSIEENVYNASLTGISFRSMESALIAQARNYTNSIVKLAEQKQKNSNSNTKGKRLQN